MRSDAILQRLLSLHPKAIDLTLARVERLLARLGHPERRLPPTLHVAGTNGKGSTVAMLRAGLSAAGLRVHTYTSPHLAWFHERIRLAGQLIEEDHLAALLEECEAVNAGEPITFFEITTAAAFLAYARTPAEALVLEVGLGGRLDATNVVTPQLCIITPVQLDHQQYLGETLAQIAAEKAGILKPAVPAVIGPQEPAALAVIEARAAALNAPLRIWGRDFITRAEGGRLVYQDDQGLLDLPAPILPGAHQYENAGAVIATLRWLGHEEQAIEAALTRAEWPARLQRLRRGPLLAALPAGAELWLDGGHNPAAGQVIAAHFRQLRAQDRQRRPLVLICGMINTKDPEGFLAAFAGLADHVFAVDIPGEANTLSAERIADAAASAGLTATMAADVATALTELPATMAPRVLICGSLYLAGRILRDNG